ncbi:MAG: methyltransferase domain-containing protein [Proteobacteria bacterium]|nr:methyltransferase domain-containing protein [Pseudomonadota bacterium]
MQEGKQIKEYYDDFSTWYERERHHGYHAMLDRLELEVLTPLAVDKDVLEVGAGTGLLMQGLAQTARRLVGLDISAGMLGAASKRGFEVAQGSAVDLPFESEQFDLAYSFKVLAHVPDIEKALGEMARVLKPGGYLVAEFYNSHSVRRIAKQLSRPGKISKERTEADVFTRWDTPDQIKSYLPAEVTLEGWRGVRVFTPAALAFRIPGANKLLPVLESWAIDSPLARFGGFLIAVCRKQ